MTHNNNNTVEQKYNQVMIDIVKPDLKQMMNVVFNDYDEFNPFYISSDDDDQEEEEECDQQFDILQIAYKHGCRNLIYGQNKLKYFMNKELTDIGHIRHRNDRYAYWNDSGEYQNGFNSPPSLSSDDDDEAESSDDDDEAEYYDHNGKQIPFRQSTIYCGGLTSDEEEECIENTVVEKSIKWDLLIQYIKSTADDDDSDIWGKLEELGVSSTGEAIE